MDRGSFHYTFKRFTDYVRPALEAPFTWLPDHALMVAVLVQADHDLGLAGIPTRRTNDSRSGAVIADDAYEWFMNDDMAYPFSFARICLELRLDPGAVRKALLSNGHKASPPRHRIGRTGGFRRISRHDEDHWVSTADRIRR